MRKKKRWWSRPWFTSREITPALWSELLTLAQLYPDPEQFRQKAIIAAALRGVDEETLVEEGIIMRKMRLQKLVL